MGRGYVVVERKGEVKAVQNLIIRLGADLGMGGIHWAEPIRGKRLLQKAGILEACALVRSKPDAEMMLILRDADDDCPATSGPMINDWLREESLPFPAAVVLFCREYETLFLPCLGRMAGFKLRDDRGIERPGINADTRFTGADYESVRGVKEWLSGRFPRGRSYKPSLDQLPMTRLIDFNDLRTSQLASFGTLERALRYLDVHRSKTGTYPPKLPQSLHPSEAASDGGS